MPTTRTFLAATLLLLTFLPRAAQPSPPALGRADLPLPQKPATHPFNLATLPPPPINPGGSAPSINPGTPGKSLPPPADRHSLRFAILGDAAPRPNAPTLADATRDLNLLKPDLVFSIGNQISDAHRTADDYAADVKAYFASIADLESPLYPVAGTTELAAADPADRRFEALYQHFFAPLYYSLDYQAAHFIVLDSEEAATPALSDVQLAWLQNDLNKAFDNARITHVIVLIHRPLWRDAKSNWPKVQTLLADFNRRPVVTVEGAPPGARRTAAHVDAVFAGHLQTLSKEPDRDGIAYMVVGPTAAPVEQPKATGQMQSYTFATVDAAGTHIAELEPGVAHADDAILARDRDRTAMLAQLNESQMGIAGTADQPRGKPVEIAARDGKLKLQLTNPLDVPIDVVIRLAFSRTHPPGQPGNPYTEGLDSAWELHQMTDTNSLNPKPAATAPWAIDQLHGAYHIGPGQSVSYGIGLASDAMTSDVIPPQLEFEMRFIDSRGHSVPVLLRRRVPLIPSASIKLLTHPGGPTPADWEKAYRTSAFAQIPAPGEKPQPNPDIDLLADTHNLYLHLNIEDDRPSYTPDFAQPWNLPSDAVTIAFAPTASTPADQVQRIVILPFADGGPLLLANTGVGEKQTPLLRLDEKAHPVKATVNKTPRGYAMEITIPRKTLCDSAEACIMNIAVADNDTSPRTLWRSWAREDLGPPGWTHVAFAAPATQPATVPAARPLGSPPGIR